MNLLGQGQFVKSFELKLFECDLKERYYSKLFLFEKCLIVSKILGQKQLKLQLLYDLDGLKYQLDEKTNLTLYENEPGNQEIIIPSNDNSNLKAFILLLEQYLKEYTNVILRQPSRNMRRSTSGESKTFLA